MVSYSKDQAFLDAYSMENCSYLAKIEKNNSNISVFEEVLYDS